jgi:hypothetical protein
MELVIGTPGVTRDFVRYRRAASDADMVVEALDTVFMQAAPLTILEKTLSTTGGAQTLVFDAPIYGQTDLGSPVRLMAIDLGVTMNALSVPKTDMKFSVFYENAAGVVVAARTQTFEGTASIYEGSVRQRLRILPFERSSVMGNAGVVTQHDSQVYTTPIFGRPDPTQAAALATATGLTLAELTQLLPDWHERVARIVIDLPAGGFAAGVTINAGLLTSGRDEVLREFQTALTLTKQATGPSVDSGRPNFLTSMSLI